MNEFIIYPHFRINLCKLVKILKVLSDYSGFGMIFLYFFLIYGNLKEGLSYICFDVNDFRTNPSTRVLTLVYIYAVFNLNQVLLRLNSFKTRQFLSKNETFFSFPSYTQNRV